MFFSELKRTVVSIINESDPHRQSKELQLRNWCWAFMELFMSAGQGRLPFFLSILSDESCWEKTDTIHRIKLNRRTVAKMMVRLQNFKGVINPLNEFDRLQIACWCSLEKDILKIFEDMKNEAKMTDEEAKTKLVNTFSKATWSDESIKYWLHVVGDRVLDLQLEGKHLYEYGLHIAVHIKRRGYLEAVEFFWNKIESLTENELSAEQKHQIFMGTTVQSTRPTCKGNPEIFEFCFDKISPDNYPEVLGRDLVANKKLTCFNTLRHIRRFDHFQKLFDCCRPSKITTDDYFYFLTCLKIEQYSENYEIEAVKLLTHIWTKKKFGSHRAFVLDKEMSDLSGQQGMILMSLVRKNYMDVVCKILGQANHDQITSFMNSKQAIYICTVLENRGDIDSLDKFYSYQFPVNGLEQLSIICTNGNLS